MKLSEALNDLGRPVAYYPSLAIAFGSVKAGVLFAQLFFWQGKGGGEDGWVYKSAEALREETGLSYKEQRAARSMLVETGILEEYYHRIEHNMYFRINMEALDDFWEKVLSVKSSPEMPKGELPKCPKVSSGDAQKSVGECPDGKFVNMGTESTTEMTSKSTTENNPLPSPKQRNIYGLSDEWSLQLPKESVARKAFCLRHPLVGVIRRICNKKTAQLGHKDQLAMAEVVEALLRSDVTQPLAEEFERKVVNHWTSRDRNGFKNYQSINQVLEYWDAVLALPEPDQIPKENHARPNTLPGQSNREQLRQAARADQRLYNEREFERSAAEFEAARGH